MSAKRIFALILFSCFLTACGEQKEPTPHYPIPTVEFCERWSKCDHVAFTVGEWKTAPDDIKVFTAYIAIKNYYDGWTQTQFRQESNRLASCVEKEINEGIYQDDTEVPYLLARC